ncbi:MAG: S9 family peptidase [Gammaproteobacteria bacterium]|nr:S9 family peptidase [Gammaproteobacteria bacterium]
MTDTNESSQPPIADRREHVRTLHGIEIKDPYFWLKDSTYPRVDDQDILDYLVAENKHFERYMAPLQDLTEQLFQEIKGRQVEDESSVPVKNGKYVYQTRYLPEKQYQQHVRWPLDDQSSRKDLPPPASDVQIVLDENALADGNDYFRRRGFSIDPTDGLLAYGVDFSGNERYTLRVLDIALNEHSPIEIPNTTGESVWSNDGKHLFYVVNNENWRPFRVLRHTLGTDTSEDAVVYEEHDDGFFVDIDRSTSRDFLILSTASNVTSEVRVLSLDSPDSELTLIASRRAQHEYEVDHHRNQFVIRTNDHHKNFGLVVASEDDPTIDQWQPLLEGSDVRYITDVRAFGSHIVIAARENGLETIQILDINGQRKSIPFSESTYSLWFGSNPESDPNVLRIEYSSLTTPETTYDYEFETGNLHVRKVQRIPSGHDPQHYVTERAFATARDGVQVPISLLYREDTPRDGTAPLYLYGYGAYGATMDPYFRTTILSMVDRGFVYAIAHIRGGSELGYHWYESGKLRNRTNTFNDFIDVARFLIDEQYTATGQIAIAGGSAGGSLMGAAINQAPELWGAVAAHVPFVDILNTMLDDSLPLTPIEWPEWGNPIESKKDLEYIRSYSPYDQLEVAAYPPLFVTAGLNDPRVTYWEPAKWVAKIRYLKTDENPLVLKTEMGAGHGGKSGRYEALREVAEEYAFILNAMGLADQGSQNRPELITRDDCYHTIWIQWFAVCPNLEPKLSISFEIQ